MRNSPPTGGKEVYGVPPGNSTARPGARIVNVALGAWLFISAFLWPHSPQSFTNTWLLGLIIAVIGVAGAFMPAVRWLNTAAAIWLFISTLWMYNETPATAWSNAIVAVIVGALSVVPTIDRTTRPTRSSRYW